MASETLQQCGQCGTRPMLPIKRPVNGEDSSFVGCENCDNPLGKFQRTPLDEPI